MSIFTGLRKPDGPTWTFATRTSPLVIQPVIAVLLLALWVLGKWPFNTESGFASERAWMLTATAVATAVALGVAGVLSKFQSWRYHALALSLTGCSAVVLTSGMIYAFLVLS